MARIQHATGTAVSANPITATFSAAVAGNLLVAAVVYRYASYSDLTATAGWTRAIYAENDVANGGNSPVVVVFYKMAAGGETSVAHAEVLVTAAKNNSWTGLGNFLNVGVSIEVLSAPDATGSALPSRRGINVPGLAGRTRRGW